MSKPTDEELYDEFILDLSTGKMEPIVHDLNKEIEEGTLEITPTIAPLLIGKLVIISKIAADNKGKLAIDKKDLYNYIKGE